MEQYLGHHFTVHTQNLYNDEYVMIYDSGSNAIHEVLITNDELAYQLTFTFRVHSPRETG